MHFVKCSHCNSEYKVDPEFAGKSIKCQECNNFFEVTDIYQKKRKPSLEELAVSYKIITKEQLAEAQSIQQTEAQLGNKTALTDIFLQKKMMTQEQLGLIQDIDKYLELRVLDKQFGKIAIQKGFLSDREIKLALSVQAISFKKNKYCRLLGDILIESGVMDASQRDLILEEQKRVDQMPLQKNGKVYDAESEAGSRSGGGVKGAISSLKSGDYKELFHILTRKKALIVLSAIILVTVGLMIYASTLKPKNYRSIDKDGGIDGMFSEKKVYKYPFAYSVTLKDMAYLHLEMEVEFYDINGFEEFDTKLSRIRHAFNLVYTPRKSSQIRSRKKIPRTLKKILSSQMDVDIANIRVTKYELTKPDSSELADEKRDLPDFSFK